MKHVPLALLLLAVLACSPDLSFDPGPRTHDKSFVAGYVKYQNGQPASSVRVDLLEHDGSYIPYDFVTVRQTKCTNEKGYFSFTWSYDSYRGYTVEVAYESIPASESGLSEGNTKYVTLYAQDYDPLHANDCGPLR